MKKKILSLILVLMLLPFASLFVACGKENVTDLSGLDNEFNKIVTENNNISEVDGKFIFDYSVHDNLANIINENSPYNELNNYNYVFDNLMSFSFSYIDECSIKDKDITEDIKNEVESNLADLKRSINNVNESVNMFAEMVIVANGEEITSPACILRFENLLVSYNTMFEKAINFSNSLSNLYFNHILKGGNPNVYGLGLDNFDANIVVNKFRSRAAYQLSNLSQSFVEMYVEGNLSRKIANKETTLDLTKYNYKSNIEAIVNAVGSNFEENIAAEKANNETNKFKFFELSVQSQNIQATLNNDRNKFVTACNDIDYVEVKNDETANAHDKMCVSIIEENYNLICNYNAVLAEMLQIMLNTGA